MIVLDMQTFTFDSNIRPIFDEETDYINVATRRSYLKRRSVPPS